MFFSHQKEWGGLTWWPPGKTYQHGNNSGYGFQLCRLRSYFCQSTQKRVGSREQTHINELKRLVYKQNVNLYYYQNSGIRSLIYSEPMETSLWEIFFNQQVTEQEIRVRWVSYIDYLSCWNNWTIILLTEGRVGKGMSGFGWKPHSSSHSMSLQVRHPSPFCLHDVITWNF